MIPRSLLPLYCKHGCRLEITHKPARITNVKEDAEHQHTSRAPSTDVDRLAVAYPGHWPELDPQERLERLQRRDAAPLADGGHLASDQIDNGWYVPLGVHPDNEYGLSVATENERCESGAWQSDYGERSIESVSQAVAIVRPTSTFLTEAVRAPSAQVSMYRPDDSINSGSTAVMPPRAIDAVSFDLGVQEGRRQGVEEGRKQGVEGGQKQGVEECWRQISRTFSHVLGTQQHTTTGYEALETAFRAQGGIVDLLPSHDNPTNQPTSERPFQDLRHSSVSAAEVPDGQSRQDARSPSEISGQHTQPRECSRPCRLRRVLMSHRLDGLELGLEGRDCFISSRGCTGDGMIQ